MATKKELQKLAKELNELCELEGDDVIDHKQSEKKLQKELVDVVAGDEPELDIYAEDDFSEDSWKTLAELGNKVAIEKQEESDEDEDEDESSDEEETEEEDSSDEEDEDEGEDEDESIPDRDEILGMNRKDVVALIEEHGLEVDPDEYKGKKNLDALREAVADELGGETEEEDEEEAEDEAEEEVDLVEQIKNTSKLNELKAMTESYNEFKKLRKKAKDFKGLQGTKKLKAEMLKALGVEEEDEKPEKKSTKKAEKAEKTEKKSKKKDDAPKMKRVDTVNQAIAELCKSKKGATYEDIYKRGDEIYAEHGGKAGSIATNITKNTIQTLLYFEVLEEKNGKLKMTE